MVWLILVFIVIFALVVSSENNKKQTESTNQKLKQSGYDADSRVYVGKYIAGHPDIDKTFEKIYIVSRKNNFEIMNGVDFGMPYVIGKIEKANVKNIVIEDQTTIEKRVTVGRLLMVGPFAFAWKKKKKNEIAYLTIEWNDGRFDHETIFEFEGAMSMNNANIARNKIIGSVKNM